MDRERIRLGQLLVHDRDRRPAKRGAWRRLRASAEAKVLGRIETYHAGIGLLAHPVAACRRAKHMRQRLSSQCIAFTYAGYRLPAPCLLESGLRIAPIFD